MTHPSSPPAPMTAERLEEIRRQYFDPEGYNSTVEELVASHDALTARVAELERERDAYKSGYENHRVQNQEAIEKMIERGERVSKLETELAAARKVENVEIACLVEWLSAPLFEGEDAPPEHQKAADAICKLHAALKEAERRETEAKTLQHQLASDLTVVVARAQAAEAKLYAAMDALTFILPLAKGYAHEHPVGANQRHVDEAAETLRALQTKDTTL